MSLTRPEVLALINGGNVPVYDVLVATTAPIGGSPVYNNGTGGIGATLTGTGAIPDQDNVPLFTGDRLLVKNEASLLTNGIYLVTDDGLISGNYLLTRTTDYDTTAEIYPSIVFVLLGDTQAGSYWEETTIDPVVGVDDIVYISAPEPQAVGSRRLQGADVVVLSPLPNSPVYNNGTLGVGATLTSSTLSRIQDYQGVTILVNMKMLIAGQADPAQNGLYKVYRHGINGSASWLLRRVADMDQSAEIYPTLVYISNGSFNGTQYATTTKDPIMGTDPILFQKQDAPLSDNWGSWNSNRLGNILSVGNFIIVTNATAANSGVSVRLLCYCDSANSILGNYAVDLDNPTDIITYNFNSDVITYREDTLNNISAYSDWRNGIDSVIPFGSSNIQVGAGAILVLENISANAVIGAGSAILANTINEIEIPPNTFFNLVIFDIQGESNSSRTWVVTVAQAQALAAGNLLLKDVPYSIQRGLQTPVTSFANIHDLDLTPDGGSPNSALINVNGILYGAPQQGGANSFGTLFSINPDSSGFTNRHDFAIANGATPNGLINVNGILYGTTGAGGLNSVGMIFSINPDGSGFVNRHDFDNTPDGSQPQAGLVYLNGVLFGTCSVGGVNNKGTIFSINPDGSGFTNLHSFDSVPDGDTPYAALINTGGVLYGTCLLGGANNNGTIFSINPDGSGFTNRHDFDATPDGSLPKAALLNMAGILYGTAQSGGANANGTIFSINPDGTGFTNRFDFDNVTSGQTPNCSLINVLGVLYGSTTGGGVNSDGTLFSINPDGTGFLKLYDFDATPDGSSPYSLLNIAGILYGNTSSGGSHNNGTIFSFQLPYATQLLSIEGMTAELLKEAGSALVLQPDYYGGGDYSNVSGFDTAMGLYQFSNQGGYVNGDCVVDDGLNYVVIDDTQFSINPPHINNDAYAPLPLLPGYGYIPTVATIKYDLTNDIVTESDLEGTINITGDSAIDLLNFEFVNKFNLFSETGTENIDEFDNFPLFDFFLYPDSGLTALTITGTAFGSIAAGKILMPTTDITLDGMKSEWFEVAPAHNDNTYLIQISGQNNIL